MDDDEPDTLRRPFDDMEELDDDDVKDGWDSGAPATLPSRLGNLAVAPTEPAPAMRINIELNAPHL